MVLKKWPSKFRSGRTRRKLRQQLSLRCRLSPIEPLEPRLLLTGDPIELNEDPVNSNLLIGAISSNLDTSGDVDYWEFQALAGDRVLIAVDTPSSDLNPTVSLRNVSDGSLASDNDGGPGADALLAPFTFNATGTYSARVASQSNTLGEYDLRVQIIRGQLQVETDRDNNNRSISDADVLALQHRGGLAVATVVGNVDAGDPMEDSDTFLVGQLNAGVSVTLSLGTPSISTLDGQVILVDESGTEIADQDGMLDARGTFNTPDTARYYARVTAASGAGSRGTYLLDVAIDDDIPPEVVEVSSLPVSNSTASILLNTFSVSFDEPLLGVSLDAEGSVQLTAAGPDDLFDTFDDFNYSVINEPSYVAGTRVSFAINGGETQEGRHRLRLAPSVTDVSGNALDGNGDGTGGDPYDQIFTIALPSDTTYVYEETENATKGEATPIGLSEDPNGTFQYRGMGLGSQSIASGNLWADEDWWSFSGEAGDYVAIAVDTPSSDFNAYIELYDATRRLASEDNGGPGTDPLLSGYRLPSDGTYFVRVGNWSNSEIGNYQVRIDLSRGVIMETDAQYHNDSLSNADLLTLSSGEATIAGLVQGTEGSNRDEDRFNLGILTAGNDVQLSLRLPSGSSLVPHLALLNSEGLVVAEEIIDSSSEVLSVTLDEDQNYYVQVAAASGEGFDARYVLDVSVLDAVPPRITGVSRLPLPYGGSDEYRDLTLANAPSVYLRLNETTGPTLADSSGHPDGPHDGSVVGTPSYTSEGPFGPTGDAAIGIGGDAHLEIPDNERVDPTRGVSFSFWMKVDSFANTWMPLVFKGTANSNQRSYALWLRNNGSFTFGSSDSVSGLQGYNTGTGLIGVGSWNHVAGLVDRDSGVIKLWVNGVERLSGSLRTNDIRVNDNPLLLGDTFESSSSYSKFDGTIDEFALWAKSVNSNDLLRPYFDSQWLGAARGTDQLLSSFGVTVSERLIGSSVNYQGTVFNTFGGHTYVLTNSIRTLADGRAASRWTIRTGGRVILESVLRMASTLIRTAMLAAGSTPRRTTVGARWWRLGRTRIGTWTGFRM